jgi:acyl carrier protein
VKLRGHRIDLGEVEFALRRHPSVRETIVALPKEEQGQKRLVAYLIGANGAVPSSEELLSFLKAKLPDYMIPEAFVVLDKFPMTPNGKVNRQALPVPGSATPAENSAPPRSPIEEKVAEIWREVMKRDQIGREDDFFELGGHSLMAMMVLSRVRKTFNTNLTMRDVFEAPTIAGLAAILADEDSAPANGSSSRIDPALVTTESL